MKKIMVVLGMSLLLCLGVSLQDVVAEGTANVLITSDTAYFVEGRAFTTTIRVEHPVDLVGFQLKLLYDSTQYELIEFLAGEGLEMTANTQVLGEIRLNYADTASAKSETTELFTLTFIAKAAFDIQEQRSLLTIDETYRNEFVQLDPISTLKVVEMVDYQFGLVERALLGDVNGDGELSIIDVAFIQHYLAGTYAFDSRQTMVANIRDVEGGVNLADVMTMQLYLAGLIETLEPVIE